MLDQHPNLAVPPETDLFCRFYPLLRYYGDLALDRNRERLLGDILSTERVRRLSPLPKPRVILDHVSEPTFGGIVSAILRCWTAQQGKSRWGEKTPNNIRYWREILDYYPNAQIVHIVRDGRDVAASFYQVPFGPKTALGAAERWSRYLRQVESMESATDERNFMHVRYEDLLQRPRDSLTTICTFLGETFNEDMLDFYKVRAPRRMHTINADNLSKPLLQHNSGKWREILDDRETRAFEAVARDMLVRYGYEPALKDADPRLTRLESFYYRRVLNPVRRARGMVRNRMAQREWLENLRLRVRLTLLDPIRFAGHGRGPGRRP